jgi:hypothetical protein
MKGAVLINGRRIEVGDRVEILVGPYRGRFGLFRGRKRNAKNKVCVTPWGATLYVVIDAGAIRKAEARP